MTRRDLLTLGLGAAAAVPFTPVPWKLLDDTAKWTQNGSWIPCPPRGERSIRYTSCTLCPAGCGIEARSVGRNVVGIAPVAGHPVSHGVLCPYAFGAHQLAYHPARITQPLRNGSPASMESVVAEISRRAKTGVMAILDERPGRAVSDEYRRIVAARGGRYIVADHAAYPGLDLENVRTLISFGAPVLESWATPGRVLKLWKEERLAIVQVEADLSKTAALASKWLPARAGSEAFIAQLIAGETGMEEAAHATGVPPDKLADTLRFIHDRGPVLAVSSGEFPDSVERSIAGLNAGSNAVVVRAPSVAMETLAQVPTGSIDVLLVDHGLLGGSIPYDSLRPKLRRDGIIVSLSPYRAGVATLAHIVVPTPAFTECLDEAPTPWDAVSPSYALACALINHPAGVTTALELINRVAGGTTSPEAAIRAKVNGLYAARRGEVFAFAERTTRPVTAFKSTDDLYKVLSAGACWIDRNVQYSESRLAASGCSVMRGTAVAPPLWRPQNA